MNEMWRFWGTVLLVALVMTVISIILIRITKKQKSILIILGSLFFGLSIVLFIKGRFFSQSMQDLGYYVMSMISFLASLITIIATFIIIKTRKLQ